MPQQPIQMKIGILGTRGIPNNYGGFEQFAEFFSVYLVEQGHDVYCYNSHDHKYQEKIFQGVNIIHQNDPEHKMGTFGQFIYDYNCIIDSRKRDFDIILQNAEGVKKQIYFSNPDVEQNNAILDELESFADAINNDTTPVVTLEQATEALCVAYQIIDCFKK